MYIKSCNMYCAQSFLKRDTANGQAFMICIVYGYFWLTFNWQYFYAPSNDMNMWVLNRIERTRSSRGVIKVMWYGIWLWEQMKIINNLSQVIRSPNRQLSLWPPQHMAGLVVTCNTRMIFAVKTWERKNHQETRDSKNDPNECRIRLLITASWHEVHVPQVLTQRPVSLRSGCRKLIAGKGMNS